MAQHTLTDNLQFPESNTVTKAFFGAAVVGIVASIIGFFVNTEQFYFSYLTNFTFVATIILAALFFVMLQHITSSSWSVVLRRIPETFSYHIFLLALLFVPVFLGMQYLYDWSRPEVLAQDDLAQYKEPYLNTTFFIIRNVIYFVIWSFLGWKLYQNSVRMDNDGVDASLYSSQKVISGPGLLLFGFTLAFASFDWLMSLEFHWFSTMFGVYIFSMSFQVFLAIAILICLYLRKQGLLLNTIRLPHYEDLGKLLFGFTVFYAYIAFSQFMLYYYANIPEHTMWYYNRLQGSWETVTWMLFFGRFVIPFILLLGLWAKTNLKLLAGLSILIVVMHFIEVFYIVTPALHEAGVSIHWLDITLLLAFAGLFFGLFFQKFKSNSMIPKNDPLLAESLNKH